MEQILQIMLVSTKVWMNPVWTKASTNAAPKTLCGCCETVNFLLHKLSYSFSRSSTFEYLDPKKDRPTLSCREVAYPFTLQICVTCSMYVIMAYVTQYPAGIVFQLSDRLKRWLTNPCWEGDVQELLALSGRCIQCIYMYIWMCMYIYRLIYIYMSMIRTQSVCIYNKMYWNTSNKTYHTLKIHCHFWTIWLFGRLLKGHPSLGGNAQMTHHCKDDWRDRSVKTG